MVRVEYKDEDGYQVCTFDTQSQADEFISYNESRVNSVWDEKFELISVTKID